MLSDILFRTAVTGCVCYFLVSMVLRIFRICGTIVLLFCILSIPTIFNIFIDINYLVTSSIEKPADISRKSVFIFKGLV